MYIDEVREEVEKMLPKNFSLETCTNGFYVNCICEEPGYSARITFRVDGDKLRIYPPHGCGRASAMKQGSKQYVKRMKQFIPYAEDRHSRGVLKAQANRLKEENIRREHKRFFDKVGEDGDIGYQDQLVVTTLGGAYNVEEHKGTYFVKMGPFHNQYAIPLDDILKLSHEAETRKLLGI